jgi:hypothetical protein
MKPQRPKQSKEQKLKSSLTNLIIGYALSEEHVNYFIHDLDAELKSIYLIRDVLKMEQIIGPKTELEQKLLKFPRKQVLAVIKELKDKFPYVPAS